MNNDSSSHIIIRPMVQADISDIHDIHTECLRTSLMGHYTPQELEAWLAGRTPQGYWRSQQAGSPYLVAMINGAIIGYANWIGDELMSLFVRPEFQKTGVGTKLLEECDIQATLSCVKATLSAVEFYDRFGFKVVHEGYDVKREVRIPHIFMRRQER